MIYTVTFNPSLDYIVSVDDFKLGLTNRTSSELMLPGGKGINVSTVLMNLGIENTALGFTAGFVGKEIIRRLHEMGVKSEFIQISEGVSRINLKLKSIDGTEINGAGPVISKDKVEELMKKLEELGEGDVLFLAGSIPSSMPDDMYEQIMARLDGKGVMIVVDATEDLAQFMIIWFYKERMIFQDIDQKILCGINYEHAFHMGIAAGSASAFSENLATKEEIEAVYRQITEK